MDRRTFLAAGGATAASTALTGYRTPQTPRTPRTPRTPANGQDWQALARGMDGTLLLPHDAGYEDARVLFSRQFDSVRPRAVALCATPEDVSEAVRFARRHGVRCVPRSGRHSFGGYSTTTGLVIDTSRMRRVETAGGLAVTGAGARVIDLYDGLLPDGVVVPTGWCPTVGIAGLTLGGGFGLEGRAHGMTVDRLREARVVLADGRRIHCDAHHHPDLFWALRGGGGGNFAVATSFSFEPVRAAPRMRTYTLTWPWSRAARVLDAWQRWAPGAPDPMTPLVTLRRTPGKPPALEVFGSWTGEAGALRAALAEFVDRVGLDPDGDEVRDQPYGEALRDWFGCAELTSEQCHPRGQTPGGRIPRFGRSRTRSSLFTRPAPRAGLARLLAAFEAGQLPGATGEMNLMALGGATRQVRPDATAYVHRDALFSAGFTYVLDDAAPPDSARHAERWIDGCWRTMRRFSSPYTYQNFVDPQRRDWRRAYYGSNYPRLSRVRQSYDPDRFFRFPQGIT